MDKGMQMMWDELNRHFGTPVPQTKGPTEAEREDFATRAYLLIRDYLDGNTRQGRRECAARDWLAEVDLAYGDIDEDEAAEARCHCDMCREDA